MSFDIIQCHLSHKTTIKIRESKFGLALVLETHKMVCNHVDFYVLKIKYNRREDMF